MSHSLAQQQTALLDLLHENTINSIAYCADSMPANSPFCLKNTPSTLRGLRAYRANAQALSSSALQACYPTLQQMIGSENFEPLAHDFWQAQPPRRGDLAQWGGELAGYLKQVPQLQDLLAEHAYLSDMAQLEWALHRAATATDAALDAESFQLLTSHDPAMLRLQLSPGCNLLRSDYPVVALLQLHAARATDLHAQAREAIAQRQPQTALVWRQGLRPQLNAIDAASAALIESTLNHQPLEVALDAALRQSADFDFSAWLSASVQTGLSLGAALVD